MQKALTNVKVTFGTYEGTSRRDLLHDGMSRGDKRVHTRKRSHFEIAKFRPKKDEKASILNNGTKFTELTAKH